MNDCCNTKNTKKKFPLFTLLISITTIFYLSYLFINFEENSIIYRITSYIYENLNILSYGLAIGLFFSYIIEILPNSFLEKTFKIKQTGIKGLTNAIIAGLVFDVCSHGVLLLAVKLYKKGMPFPQVIAFLIATPWNSISLSVLLFTLLGSFWAITFIVLSIMIAFSSGIIFEYLIKKSYIKLKKQKIEKNIHLQEKPQPKKKIAFFMNSLKTTLAESKPIIRWLLIGLLIVAVLKIFITDDLFPTIFAPTLIGLSTTLILATILEVCSEGSLPLAYEIFTLAKAPGNSFALLLAGVSTDYTEIVTLKEITGSWKISFLLPVVTMPQILLISVLLNSV